MTEKLPPRLKPAVAAQKVLEDILASPQKEGLAKRAFDKERREIRSDNESFTADYFIGNVIMHEVYGTSLDGIDNTPIIERVCEPLGFVPFYDEENYDDEQMSISAGVPQMTRCLGRIARQYFDPEYKPAPIRSPKSEHELLSDSQNARYASLEEQNAPSCETVEIKTGDGDVPLMKGVTPRAGA